MSTLRATIDGIGFWAPGLPSWDAALRHVRDGTLVADAPARPSPQLLAPNERRRAPETVAVALDVALAACTAAGREPAALPSVFASAHGDMTITDYMCATLASEPRSISPTRFHNSVHNAAAGYWTIGAGAMQPATAISAGTATFAQGLIEALVQLAAGADAVLLVAYDGPSVGPVAQVSPSVGLLGAALVLSRHAREGAPVLSAELGAAVEAVADATAAGALARHAAGNAMAPMLPLFDALARADARGPGDGAILSAGPGRALTVRIHR
ncbi:beta-ketoacyl synthase chain length factor [Lysobacter solisilvae (ex Woo and Kim 2020)]|uniref:Beta-ketoacyl synthase chain length factor n=1 Tax=Agrilutibacter terrestris TaxID=2865112 RepID=A0A7H0FU36_9GAMM|nr:beta-ketoacyl synthase chain length factor [Lysobacter terrestris]QNP39552.1 beta-ketoacyl synthase chain length factor [Lysobacter terrestris]